ncbi:MAG: hypothetical protein A2Y82_04030 [Candidatus Buchananbacteria bacterium RBG_13_36_9]|uniref:Uncharacterized protein n=1 Tax=Candidatus Buchananbacteria bacterium RBG_13_36_9 TaxID=1797530 RepID=A0A1G1XR57_9BACT|nr:MAG: hypothetical protein A2Y82_04030 [Candidatus Buchananbacteria bacterium RBG_13_36_9]
MKSNKILLYIIIVVLIVGAVIAYAYYTGRDGRKMAISNTSQPLIGGQTDEGGCLIGAGYSWCEPKQKCLRIWEEKCYENEEAALTQLFAAEHNQTASQTNVTVNKLKDDFAAGSISFGSDAGEGGVFLARLDNGTWIIDYEGNGSIDCVKIKDLGYSQDVLEGFCD